jgi:hypothetical protein
LASAPEEHRPYGSGPKTISNICGLLIREIWRNVKMQSDTHTAPVSKKALWTGRIISVLPVLFLLVDGVMKLIKPAVVVEATVKLGYPETVILPLGIVLLACTVLYVIPRTSVLGAILLTGYLGGAVATHVRVGEGLFSIVFPIIFGVLVWGGLYLRDEQLRALIPLRKGEEA